METQLEQIREQQKQSWNKFSPGWRKWDDLTMDFLKPMGDEIIRKLKLQDGDVVLDVATGTGEPGLTIAEMLESGKVISTDLAEGMLEIARENAMKRGIKNFETKVSDVSEMPFADNTFDAVSCRFGYMFFPDLLLATKEMVRVLKRGGRIAVSVWYTPEKNFWITAVMDTINKNIELPPPPQGAPGMFRCAKNGFIADLFKQAGLHNISETEIRGKLDCGTADAYWGFMTEVAAAVAAALSKADKLMTAKIKSEVYELINQKYPEGKVAIDASALIISGEK